MDYDYLIDIKGLCCSAPIIRLTTEFKAFAADKTILVISDKSSMLNDIPAYCGMTNHKLVKQEQADGLYRFWIKKH